MKNDKLWKISDNTSNLSTARNRRPQQAGMHFSLRPAKDVLREFNKEVGYRKRSLRRLDKENMNKKKTTSER